MSFEHNINQYRSRFTFPVHPHAVVGLRARVDCMCSGTEVMSDVSSAG